jgi:hypothetical protein
MFYTTMYSYVMVQHLNLQHMQSLRRNSRAKLSLRLNYYISWCYSERLANIIGKS